MAELVNKITLVAIVLAVLGCKEPQVPEAPRFSVADAVAKLAGMSLDNNFFATLDELKQHATHDPEAAMAWARYSMAALGVAMVSNPEAVRRLAGAPLEDRKAVGALLMRIAEEARKAPSGALLANAASALAGIFGAGGVSDLGPTIEVARKDSVVRLVLARTLLDAIEGAAGMPEPERGPELQRRVPGLPNPPTTSPSGTAFPATLTLLSDLLSGGGDAALAPGFGQLAREAQRVLGNQGFAMPVSLGLDPTPRAQPNGVVGYVPLETATLTKDHLLLGARPVFAWEEGKAVDRTSTVGWPGVRLASVEELTGPKAPDVRSAAEKVASAVRPLEPLVYKGLSGRGVLNFERKSGAALLILAEGDAPSEALRAVMSLAKGSGYEDFRIAQPGAVGAMMPVMFQSGPSPASKRVIMAVNPQGCALYAPAKASEKLPLTGWPEGVRVVPDKKKFFSLLVPWARDGGFGGKLSSALKLLRSKTGASPLVDVVVQAKDVTALELLDAVAELESPAEPVFQDLGTYFPGAECPSGRPCLSMVPILFSSAKVPRPSGPEVTVTETRPAGFCDKAAVQRVMMGRSGAYRACYELELQRRPDIAGRVELRFTIEPDGSVSGVTVTYSDLNNKNVETCLIKQVSTLQFPKPDGGICVIRWPFKFQPGG